MGNCYTNKSLPLPKAQTSTKGSPKSHESKQFFKEKKKNSSESWILWSHNSFLFGILKIILY